MLCNVLDVNSLQRVQMLLKGNKMAVDIIFVVFVVREGRRTRRMRMFGAELRGS